MRAIKQILCPVDLPQPSGRAIEQAIALAVWCRARIVALHVRTPMLAAVPGVPLDDRVPDLEVRLLRDRVASCFESALSAGVPVDVRVAVGHPATEIVDCARAQPVDVIVMGTHGASGLQHFMLGSVAEKVLRSAPCAVLTVPPHAGAATTAPFARILCPVDFSEPSLAAFDAAVALAQTSSSALTVMHVIEWPWHEPPPPSAGDMPAAQAAALAEFRRYVETSARMRLEKLTEGLTLPVRPSPRIVHGKPYVEILRVAAQTSADLIVIGVLGRNVADMALFGSTTNHVVREAACPVLTLRQ